MSEPPAPLFRFGLYEFDVRSLDLKRQGQPVALQNQPARFLALLVRRAGSIVTKEELIQQVWQQKTHVNFDEGLSYCAKQVRKALRDDADNPCFIQNIPRRGYRFIAPVEAVAPQPSSTTSPPAPMVVRYDLGWVRRAVWFFLGLMAILLLYFIYEDFPR